MSESYTEGLNRYFEARKKRDEAHAAFEEAQKNLHAASQFVLEAACAVHEERRLREERRADKHM